MTYVLIFWLDDKKYKVIGEFESINALRNFIIKRTKRSETPAMTMTTEGKLWLTTPN